jgi:hypothetical protein
MLVTTNAELRAALRVGSTLLVYYYGMASQDGMLLEGGERCFAWSELVDLLQRSRSVSAVFLNLLGETSFNAISQARALLDGAIAVLLQCNERMAASAAARAALDWLHSVFAASERLDPVMALHQHQHGQVTAWTRYASWQTATPVRIEMPGLVNLLLDRSRQRADLLAAKEDFYSRGNRRIYHAVAVGTEGCRVAEFPAMVSQYLRNTKREQEVFLHRAFRLPMKLDPVQRVDELVRQQLGMTTRQSVLSALLGQATIGTAPAAGVFVQSSAGSPALPAITRLTPGHQYGSAHRQPLAAHRRARHWQDSGSGFCRRLLRHSRIQIPGQVNLGGAGFTL